MSTPDSKPKARKSSPRRRAAQKPARKRPAGSNIKTARGLSRALTHHLILAGVSAALVKSAVEHNVLALDEVYRFIPKSTFARKLRSNSTLSVEEGDRLARLARIKSYAGEVLGSDRDAETWLGEPNPRLGGDAPIDLLLTDDGARRVETILRRIDYGDYS